MTGKRINLEVPFADKDKAKALGAKWDVSKKTWFVMSHQGSDLSAFLMWRPHINRMLEKELGRTE
jgi:hypothetical protein